jgi:hypothetical protein
MSKREADYSKGIEQCKATWRYRDKNMTGPYGCHTFVCKLEVDHDGPHVDHFGIWNDKRVEEQPDGKS